MDLPSRERVKEIYREKFLSLPSRGEKRITHAYHLTLAQFMPMVADKLAPMVREISQEVPLEEKDPFALAVNAALQEITRERLVEMARDSWNEAAENIYRQYKSSPKDWSPVRKGFRREKEYKEALEKIPLFLILRFDEWGGYRGWIVSGTIPFDRDGLTYVGVGITREISLDDIRVIIEADLNDTVDWYKVERELRG